MIDRSNYLESVSEWHLHPLEMANDRLLCAFVSLRLITSTHMEMMTTQHAQQQRHETSRYRSMLRMADGEIVDWQKRWTETVSRRGEDCHVSKSQARIDVRHSLTLNTDLQSFLIPFYGIYARLLLYTSSLRASTKLTDNATRVDIEAIWHSYSSALDMLKLVSEPSASQLVYYAQDSVHVMIGGAVVFLIKVPHALSLLS
jgi:hypothetical protein